MKKGVMFQEISTKTLVQVYILIDYLFFDYLIVLAQKKDSRIAEVFRTIEPNNPDCDELVKILGEPFDEAKWNTIKKDTYLFKLTWKQEFPLQKNGQDTFYAKLLSRDLDCLELTNDNAG